MATDVGWTLGYPFDGVAYRADRLALAPGDVILFYTDGLTDVASQTGADADRLGTAGLANLLCGAVSAGQTGIPDRVFEALDTYRGESPFEDDATAFAVRVR